MSFDFFPIATALRDQELSLRLISTGIDGGVPAYSFAIHIDGVPAEVGTIRLRPLTTPHLEQIRGHIGYAVHEPHRGHRYAERAARLLLPLAKAHGIDPLWITCEPGNVASRRTCERLGATLVEIRPIPPGDIAYAQGQREKCRYGLPLSERALPFEYFDVGPLRDGNLSVVCTAKNPADPGKNWVQSYDFKLFRDGFPEPAGRINLRAINVPNLRQLGGHFGYTVAPEHRGHHFAERGVRLLLPLARRHGMDVVWITCNPDNWPSRRTCERLGGEMVEIVPVPPDHEMYYDGDREKCRYRIQTPAF